MEEGNLSWAFRVKIERGRKGWVNKPVDRHRAGIQ